MFSSEFTISNGGNKPEGMYNLHSGPGLYLLPRPIVGGNNYMLLDPFKYFLLISLNAFYSAKCTVNKWLCTPFYFYFKLKTLTEMETFKQ